MILILYKLQEYSQGIKLRAKINEVNVHKVLNKNCDTILTFYLLLRNMIILGKEGRSKVSKLLDIIGALVVVGLHPDLGYAAENLHELH